jgi:hypothetical protein
LLRAAVAFVPVSALFAYSGVLLAKHRTVASLIQLLGAATLMTMVGTHVAEGLHVFPAMRWGQPASPGHYLDLSSALLGVTLTLIGYILHRRGRLSAEPQPRA